MEDKSNNQVETTTRTASSPLLLKKFVPPRAAGEKPVLASSSSTRQEAFKPPGSVKFAIPSSTLKTDIGNKVSGQVPLKSDQDIEHKAYTCFYTDQWRKKRPAFKDGFLRIKGKSAELFKEDGTPSTKNGRYEEFIDDKDTVCAYMGSFLVQLDQQFPYQDLDSGRCFLGNYQIPQAAAPVQPAKDIKVPFLPKARTLVQPVKTAPEELLQPLHPPKKSLPELTSGISTPQYSDSNSMLLKRFQNPAEPTTLIPEESSKALLLCSPDTHPNEVQFKCYIDDFLMEYLMPHQVKGIQFMFECLTGIGPTKQLSGCILGDSMGLGKTLQVVALMWILLRQNPAKKEPFAKKILVVCPVSLVHNWRNEVLNWLGEKRLYPLVADGTEQPQDILTKFSRDNYRCCIISYEALTNYNMYLSCAIDVVFCDEGHRLKNTDIKIYRILNGLRASRRVLITGTPIQNNLMELFACVSFVNPHIFKNEKSFKRVYADPISRGLVKQAPKELVRQSKERAKELMEIVSSMMVRRTNKILEEFLPERKEFIIYLNASQQQLTEYNRILESCRKAGMTASISQDSMFSLLAQIRKILMCPGEGNFLNPRTSCKVAFLGELLMQTDSNSKLIIVSYFTTVLDLVEGYLAEIGVDWARLDGTMGQKERTKSIEKFNSPGCNVFLLAAKAGGTGLNLVMASRMVMLDVDWNPSNDAQVMGRIYRKGQTRPVEIFRLVVAGTVEEKIMERQISKVDLSNLVADSLETSARFTADELKELFNVSKGLVGKFVRNKKNVKNQLLKVKVCRAMEKLVQWVIVDKEQELEELQELECLKEESDQLENTEDNPPLGVIREEETEESDSDDDIPTDTPALLFECFEIAKPKDARPHPPNQHMAVALLNLAQEAFEALVDRPASNQSNEEVFNTGIKAINQLGNNEDSEIGQSKPESPESHHSPHSSKQCEQRLASTAQDVGKSSRTSAEVDDILQQVHEMFN